MSIKFTSSMVVMACVVGTLVSSLVAAEQEPAASDLLPACGQAVVGAKAPWLSGWTLDEHIFNIGKPFHDESAQRVALVFWASWCQPCMAGLERLVSAENELEAAGVAVVLVNYGESAQVVAKFIAGRPLPFPIVLDPYQNCRDSYLWRPDEGVRLPLTVMIDRDSVVTQIIGLEGEDYVSLLLGRESDE